MSRTADRLQPHVRYGWKISKGGLELFKASVIEDSLWPGVLSLETADAATNSLTLSNVNGKVRLFENEELT